MAKFLFVVPPFSGHINPTLGLGGELLKNGHDVAWLSFDPDLEKKLPEKGRFLLLAADIDELKREQIKDQISVLSKRNVYGLDSLKFLYEEVLTPLNEGILENIKELIDKYRPDIIINDQQIFAGAVAAIHKNIPYVTSVTAPAAIKVSESLPMVYEWEGEQIVSFQKKAGIEGNIRLDCSSRLTLVYTSHEFFGSSEMPEHYKFIGPVIANRNREEVDFDWNRFNSNKKRPKILISIGTTFDHSLKEQFFNKVIDAFSNQDVMVVLVSDLPLGESTPENFIVSKRVPQLELLPHIDAVVCHGGHNTVCEALSYAVPLVVLPIAYDQSYVAGCVTNAGAGVRLNFNRFKADHLRDAVNTVLSDNIFKEKARAIQKSFIDAGGVQKAVSYLEDILSK